MTKNEGVTLNRAVQVGIVVRDLERTTELLAKLFGIGPFRFIEWPNRPNSKYWYRGEEQNIKLRQAFVQVGNLELAFIQPIEGEHNAYKDSLEQKGGGLHHVLFEIEDMDAAVSTLGALGVKPLQAGTGIRRGTKWTLLDSQDEAGFLVELRHVAQGCDGTSIPKEQS
jgi:hypothetical protein